MRFHLPAVAVCCCALLLFPAPASAQQGSLLFGTQFTEAALSGVGGTQPMATPDGRRLLAFNGAIVNHVEVGAALRAEGVALRTRSDTEVLLHLLAREGERGLARANGMFAFAFLDGADGRMLLGRDPCGIKPLYWLDRGEAE